MRKIYFVLFFYTLLYVVLYFVTLNINYVEGDDAATVLYHLCGQNPAIQKPYAAYNSGFDWLLQVMNLQSETALRTFSIGISFVFGYLVLCFSALFLDLAFRKNSSNAKYLFLALLPFIVPDFIFHSLLLNSSNISFAFALASIICYMHFFLKGKWAYFILSILFLAIAIPFRWSMVTIFPMFFSLLFLYNEKSVFYRVKIAVLHNAAALILGISLIYVSGYNLTSIINTIIWGRSYVENAERSVLSMLATGSAFFTAPFVILLAAGLFYAVTAKRKRLLQNIAFAFLPLIPFFILGFAPAFKFLLTFVPVLLMLALTGFLYLSDLKFLHGLFLTVLILCWFVGIRIDASGTAAGPGFEQSIAGKLDKNTTVTDRNMDGRVKIKKVRPTLGGGFYMPMLEGPRPMYGYFYVIFGGGWKQNIQQFTDDRNAVATLLKDKKFTYLQDRKTAYFQCDLFRNGYKTTMPFVENGDVEFRDFIKNSDTIKVLSISDNISKVDYAAKFINANDKVIFRSAYSSMILNLARQTEGIRLIGPYTIQKGK